MLENNAISHQASDNHGIPSQRSTGRLQRLTNTVASVKPFYQQLTSSSSASTEQLLIRLLQQHSSETGWIVLVAPPQLPSKALAEYLKLPVEKILVIHSGAIKNIAATLQTLMSSTNCRVIINFSQLLSEPLTEQLSNYAANKKSWFYQFSQQQPQPH